MSNFVTVADGARIFYKDWGTGQPIVFAHGWPLPVHVVFPAACQQPPRLRAFIDAMKAALPQLHGMRPAPR